MIIEYRTSIIKNLKLNLIMMLIISLLLIFAVIGIAHLCVTNKATVVPSNATMQWSTDTCWGYWRY